MKINFDLNLQHIDSFGIPTKLSEFLFSEIYIVSADSINKIDSSSNMQYFPYMKISENKLLMDVSKIITPITISIIYNAESGCKVDHMCCLNHLKKYEQLLSSINAPLRFLYIIRSNNLYTLISMFELMHDNFNNIPVTKSSLHLEDLLYL